MLRTLFAGRNHFFDAKTTFSVNFYHKMFKKLQKETIKHVKKGVYQRLGVTLKRWLTPISWLTPEENVTFSSGVDQLLGVNQL